MKTPYIAYPSTFFKKISLVEVIYLLIRCSKTKFFLRNTTNTDETHTPNTQRKITVERVSRKVSTSYSTSNFLLTMFFAANPSITVFLILNLSNNVSSTSGPSTVVYSTIVSSTFCRSANSTSGSQYANHKKIWAEVSVVLSKCYWKL